MEDTSDIVIVVDDLSAYLFSPLRERPLLLSVERRDSSYNKNVLFVGEQLSQFGGGGRNDRNSLTTLLLASKSSILFPSENIMWGKPQSNNPFTQQ